MTPQTHPVVPDIASFNAAILTFDLDSLDPEGSEPRFAATLAALFGDEGWGDTLCGQFSCVGYMPG